jgi:LPS export ABC transporter protein LptC
MLSSLFLRRLLGGILLAAVAALAVAIVIYFIRSSLRESKSVERSPAVELALKSIHFTESDASVRKYELFAASGEYDKVTDTTSLTDIRFVVERGVKDGPVTVTSRHGEYFHASKNVNLQGDVIARTKDGTTFETSKVMYNSTSRVLSGNDRVKLVDAALTVDGIGFDLKVDSRETRVHSDVTATIYPGKRKR